MPLVGRAAPRRRPVRACGGPSTAAPREAIYRVGEDGRRSFFDTDVKPGQAIRYAVVAVNASGRIVGVGGPDRVVIPTSRRRRCERSSSRAVDTVTLADGGRALGCGTDERALVERAQADPSAFAELYRRYLPRVHAFAYRRTGAVEAAEDVTSAAFERALRNLGSFHWRPGGFGPWLFRIVANELVDHYRRTGRAALASGRRAAAARLAAAAPRDPADEVGDRDAVAEMLAAMDRLSPRYQQALALRYLAGPQPDEAAAAMGVSKATLAVVVHRATRALRRALDEEEPVVSDDSRRRLEEAGGRPAPPRIPRSPTAGAAPSGGRRDRRRSRPSPPDPSARRAGDDGRSRWPSRR